jgi:hypothetical protein
MASKPSGAAEVETVRIRRLREDSRRPLSVNLAEGIALSRDRVSGRAARLVSRNLP